MDQDIPGETFQEVADIAKEAVQKKLMKFKMLKNFKKIMVLLRKRAIWLTKVDAATEDGTQKVDEVPA